MTPEEFAEKMQKARETTGFIFGTEVPDIETAHENMDDLMCQVLRDLGYGEGIDIFCNADKWYA